MIRTNSMDGLSLEEQAILGEFVKEGSLDDLIPSLARNRAAMLRIESLVQTLRTTHELVQGDSRAASALEPNSVHLVVTSPPYWTLKRYHEHDDQMGHVA